MLSFLGGKEFGTSLASPSVVFSCGSKVRINVSLGTILEREVFRGLLFSFFVAIMKSAIVIFFQCPFSKEIWSFWWKLWNRLFIHATSLFEFWNSMGRSLSSTFFLLVAWDTVLPLFVGKFG